MSTPSRASRLASAIESSSDQPPSTQSIADRRTDSSSNSSGMFTPRAPRAHDVQLSPRASARRSRRRRRRCLVGERRQEFVQEIAVRRVHLEQVEARRVRAPGRVRKGLDDVADLG